MLNQPGPDPEVLRELANQPEPDPEKLLKMLRFVWRIDREIHEIKGFDLRPFLRPDLNDLKGWCDYVFLCMSGYLSLAKYLSDRPTWPRLDTVAQPPGLAGAGDRISIRGTYEHNGLITVYGPASPSTDSQWKIASTLAHEMAHHYLRVELEKGIGDYRAITHDNDPSTEALDNEILTDVAAVWIGFGEVMEVSHRIDNVAYDRADRRIRTYVSPDGIEALRTHREFLYDRRLRGKQNPLKMADLAILPPAQWDGKFVRFVDGSTGELELKKPDVIVYCFETKSERTYDIRELRIQGLKIVQKPLEVAQWASLPPAEWDGKFVRFTDGKVGELGLEYPYVTFYCPEGKAPRRFNIESLLQAIAQD